VTFSRWWKFFTHKLKGNGFGNTFILLYPVLQCDDFVLNTNHKVLGILSSRALERKTLVWCLMSTTTMIFNWFKFSNEKNKRQSINRKSVQLLNHPDNQTKEHLEISVSCILRLRLEDGQKMTCRSKLCYLLVYDSYNWIRSSFEVQWLQFKYRTSSSFYCITCLKKRGWKGEQMSQKDWMMHCLWLKTSQELVLYKMCQWLVLYPWWSFEETCWLGNGRNVVLDDVVCDVFFPK
jgi:hypothetical protein